jgi:hypothetical protein
VVSAADPLRDIVHCTENYKQERIRMEVVVAYCKVTSSNCPKGITQCHINFIQDTKCDSGRLYSKYECLAIVPCSLFLS